MSHLYSEGMQPATNYVDKFNTKPRRFRCSPPAMRVCWRCKKKRRAKNLLVQVFYDSIRHWCKDKNCNKK